MFRRSLSTGLAIAGVGAITLTSVAALPVEQEAVAVAPRSVVAGPQSVVLTGFADVLVAGVVAALQQSADGVVDDFPAIWEQVTGQWPDPELLHWNYALVADSFLAPVAPLIVGPINDAVAQVLADAFPEHADAINQLPEVVEAAAVRLVGPLLSAIGAAGVAHEQIYYPTTTGDVPAFFEAIVKAPGTVIDGLLFGGYGDLSPLLTGEVGGEPTPAPGLLTPWGQDPPDRGLKWEFERPAVETSVVDLTAEDVAEEEPVVEPAVEEPAVEETQLEVKTEVAPSDAPDASLRQSVRDFRTGVREGLRQLVRADRSTGSEESPDTDGTEAATEATSKDEAKVQEKRERRGRLSESRASEKPADNTGKDSAKGNESDRDKSDKSDGAKSDTSDGGADD